MVKFTTKHLAEMNNEILEVSLNSSNNLVKAERSLLVVKNYIQQLKEFILGYTFREVAEEIEFFKMIKPQFLKELTYHREVYEIEAAKPVGNIDMVISHYRIAIERVRLYFGRNQEFYNYYLMDKSHLDDQYFLRNSDQSYLDAVLEIDQRFCTVHSQKLSKLQAFELVNNYLLRSIHQLENPGLSATGQNEKKFKSLWTDSKVALVELAYALYAHGSVNHGKGDIKEIVTDLEIIFNIEVGNFYRTFQNMRIRKKNPTPFLDGLKLSYERKMDEYY